MGVSAVSVLPPPMLVVMPPTATTPSMLRDTELHPPAAPEAWLDKRGIAEHYACSVRSIENAMAEGCPHAVIFGRAKFQVSSLDPWLRDRGHLQEAQAATSLTGDN